MHAFSRSGKGSGPRLTRHVRRQMQRRAIPAIAIDAVLDYGRVVYTRGAVIHAIGRNEIARWAAAGIDLAAYEGIQVVCARDGTMLTTYDMSPNGTTGRLIPRTATGTMKRVCQRRPLRAGAMPCR